MFIRQVTARPVAASTGGSGVPSLEREIFATRKKGGKNRWRMVTSLEEGDFTGKKYVDIMGITGDITGKKKAIFGGCTVDIMGYNGNTMGISPTRSSRFKNRIPGDHWDEETCTIAMWRSVKMVKIYPENLHTSWSFSVFTIQFRGYLAI